MQILFVIVFVILFPTLIAKKIGGIQNGKFLSSLTFISTIFFLLILSIINYYIPFGGAIGGIVDDSGYYNFALSGIVSMDQPGYGLFLASLIPFTGDSLFTMKAINVTFLLFIALCWYKIGEILRGSYFAKYLFVGIILTTPLYFYFFFLLKDMIIIFLFSYFLLYSLKFALYGKGIVFVLLSIVITMLFRMPLVPINLVIFTIFIFILNINKLFSKQFIYFILSFSVILLIIFIAGSEDILFRLKISTERTLTLDYLSINYLEYMGRSDRLPLINTIFLFFISETTGFNFIFRSINSDEIALRGLTGVPWVILGLPLFLIGLISIIRNRYLINPDEFKIWLCLILVIFILLIFSIIINDTTRLRMPVLPVMITIAVLGYIQNKNSISKLLIFIGSINILIFAFYFVVLKSIL